MAFVLKDRLARQAAGETQLNFDPTGRDEPRLVLLPLSLIDPDPDQPRKDLGDCADLALSIRENGVIQPIIVEPVGGDRYRILAGERRHAACRSLGLETIPCIARTAAAQSRLELQLVENLHRKDLHPVEEARAFKRLLDEFNLTQRDLARRLGKSLASVNQTLRILDLNAEVLADVQTSEHANKSLLLEIVKEADAARQQTLWQQAQSGELTVRKAREEKPAKAKTGAPGAKATIDLPEGRIVIHFRSGEATPERIIEALELALSTQRSQS